MRWRSLSSPVPLRSVSRPSVPGPLLTHGHATTVPGTVLACSSSRTDREKRACVDFCGLRSVASPFAPRAGSQLRHLHFRRPCSTRRRAGRRADGCWRVRRVGGLDMSNDRELKKHLKDEHESEVEEQELAGTAFAPCPVPGCETIHSLKGGSVGVTPRGHALLSPPPTVLHQTRAGRSRGPPQAHAIRRRRSLVWGAFTLHRGCSHPPQKTFGTKSWTSSACMLEHLKTI